jgi:hypothetical protein
MTVKKTSLLTTAPQSYLGTRAAIWQSSPCTPDEWRQRIETLGSRIAAYVRFMCEPAERRGTSTEAKQKAVAAFYAELVVAEQRLGQVQEGLLLE